MNAIKLPVAAYKTLGDLWNVRTDQNHRICRDLSEAEAKEITLALNCHDALVEALEFYANLQALSRIHVIPSSPNGFNSEIGNDARHIARAALAKVEDLRKTP